MLFAKAAIQTARQVEFHMPINQTVFRPHDLAAILNFVFVGED
jgi:hypothetical protein